jgi:hypothetical protein
LYSGLPETIANREEYIELRRQISRRTLDSNHTEVKESNEGLTQLAVRAQNLQLELMGQARALHSDLQLSLVQVSQVAARLRPGEVLLEYFIYQPTDLKTRKATGSHYGVFWLDGASGKVQLADLGEAQAITAAIEAFRNCERTQVDPMKPALDEAELARLSAVLRRLVFNPIVPSTTGINRIYIAPDGVLGFIPFETLPLQMAAGWRYLVEDTEVVYLLTGRELTRTTSRKSANGEAWLFGDPDFDATPDERIAAFNAGPAETSNADAKAG